MNEQYLEEYPNCPSEFPDELLDNTWALRIHGQTLARLNERGGMSPMEIVVNMERKNYRSFDILKKGECVEKLVTALKNQHA